MINTWGRKKKHFKLWNYCLDKGKKIWWEVCFFCTPENRHRVLQQVINALFKWYWKKDNWNLPVCQQRDKNGWNWNSKRDANVKPLKAPGIQESDRKKEAWYTRNSLERGGRVVVVVAEPGHSIHSVVWIQAGQYTYSLDGDSRPKWNGGPCCCHLCTVQEGEP